MIREKCMIFWLLTRAAGRGGDPGSRRKNLLDHNPRTFARNSMESLACTSWPAQHDPRCARSENGGVGRFSTVFVTSGAPRRRPGTRREGHMVHNARIYTPHTMDTLTCTSRPARRHLRCALSEKR